MNESIKQMIAKFEKKHKKHDMLYPSKDAGYPNSCYCFDCNIQWTLIKDEIHIEDKRRSESVIPLS